MENPPPKRRINLRLLIGIIISLACFCIYISRVNLSVAILKMVKKRSNISMSSRSSFSTSTYNCIQNMIEFSVFRDDDYREDEDENEGYDWSCRQEGLLIGAYFWGYTFTSFAGGFLSHRYGPKRVTFIGICVSIVLTSFTPHAAKIGYGVIYASRFLIGLVGAPILPCVHDIIANWVPREEKGRYIVFIEGAGVVLIITWQFVRFLVRTLDYTWGAFYVPAIFMTAVVVLWQMIIYDNPDIHPRISPEEKEFLETALERANNQDGFPPIREIATSIPFIALVFLHYGSHWTLLFFMTSGPKFLNEMVGVDLYTTGFLMVIPTVVRLCSCIIFGFIGDFLIRRKLMTTTHIRKYFTVISHIVPGCLFIMLGFFINSLTSIILMTFLMTANGASTITNMHNCQDLAPNYAGTLFGIMNAIATTAGFISPLVGSFFFEKENSLSSWRKLFFIGACIYFLTAIIFFIFGSGEIQPWNNVKKSRRKRREKTPPLMMNSSFISSHV